MWTVPLELGGRAELRSMPEHYSSSSSWFHEIKKSNGTISHTKQGGRLVRLTTLAYVTNSRRVIRVPERSDMIYRTLFVLCWPDSCASASQVLRRPPFQRIDIVGNDYGSQMASGRHIADADRDSGYFFRNTNVCATLNGASSFTRGNYLNHFLFFQLQLSTFNLFSISISEYSMKVLQ